MEMKQLWNSVLVQLELETTKANFTTWFKDTFISKVESPTVFLAVPSVFAKEWLSSKYHRQILQAFRNVLEDVRAVEYVISHQRPKKEAEVKLVEVGSTKELPMTNLFIDPEDNLNPRYTFETFVVGPFNELAYAATQAIIKKAVVYNPLFIYGNTGLGKTHLMQAVGNFFKNSPTPKRVHYVTSEKFTIDYINSVMANKINHFKEKYRKYDVLIMDDIQFLSTKEQTQTELFHLFNSMYDNNKQIIFSSDIHPNYLANLEDRLKSRFMAGMIIDISPADIESKIAILQANAQANNFELTHEVAAHLASSVDGSIRELVGALNSIICQTQLKGKELTLAEIRQTTKNSTKPHKTVSVKEVVKAVAAFYNIDEESIYDKTRKQEVVKPRQMTMYILREDFNVSFPSIGQKLGGRDHTTVIHSCDKIKNELKNNQELSSELNQIRALI